MESGERKNIQARQSSDGSFELFVGHGGLEEISEEEISVAEIVVPTRAVETPNGSKAIPLAIVSIVLIAVVAGAALLLSGEDKPRDKDGNEEGALSAVQGFRAYTGATAAEKKRDTPRRIKKTLKNQEASIGAATAIDLPDEMNGEEDNVAWKRQPEIVEDPVEARIQPNRNPSPESVDIVIHEDDNGNIIDDNNDDSKEIATQKRLGFFPTKPNSIPIVDRNSLQKIRNIKDFKPKLEVKDMPVIDTIPVPTAEDDTSEVFEPEGD